MADGHGKGTARKAQATPDRKSGATAHAAGYRETTERK